MSSEMIGLLYSILLFVLLFAGMPIGFALAFTGFVGLVTLLGLDAALQQLGSVPYSSVADYTFSVVPLFIFAGGLAFAGGLVKDLYDAAHKWLGSLHGGLAITSIGACAGFAACTGSSMASAATMTQVAWPEMKKRGYNPSFALASIAAGGTLGILIPPSIPFIVYGIITQQSVGQLFMSGVIPGIMLTLLFMLLIYVKARRNPSLAPASPGFTWGEKFTSLRHVIPGGVLALIILGGIWGGFFTATEAGGAGAFTALIIALLKRSLTWRDLTQSLKDGVRTTAMIFTLLIGAMIYGYFLTVSGATAALATFVAGFNWSATGIIIVILLIYVVLGCLMDANALTLITIPIILPILMKLHVDPVFFGCLFVINMEMALITPPIGMNVFVIGGMVKEVPMYSIFKGVWPFIIMMAAVTALVIIFPQLALYVPSLMVGH
jgi:tripartite ATP-independent transporter DctM subunit